MYTELLSIVYFFYLNIHYFFINSPLNNFTDEWYLLNVNDIYLFMNGVFMNDIFIYDIFMNVRVYEPLSAHHMNNSIRWNSSSGIALLQHNWSSNLNHRSLDITCIFAVWIHPFFLSINNQPLLAHRSCLWIVPSKSLRIGR